MSELPIQNVSERAVSGAHVEMDGESWYKIANCHLMPEFFLCPVSSSDHWMFISSRGALSAGRKNPNSALFPYYSSDKIMDSAWCTGPKSIFRCRHWNGDIAVWEPFSDRGTESQTISRNIYKNFLGDKLCLEEVNESLNLVFRYRWSFGHRFGFIRSCQLINHESTAREISFLDGMQNLMPYGLEQQFQLRYSNLGDAYKKSELLGDAKLGIFYLSSIPTDRAEPSEGLRATVAWHQGIDRAQVLLSAKQLDRFRSGLPIQEESDVRGCRGAYFVSSELHLDAMAEASWNIVANLNHDQTDVVDLQQRILNSPDIVAELKKDISNCQDRLLSIVSSADGRQMGADRLRLQRHQSNVLFNVMRGGIPCDDYQVNSRDFRDHVRQFNADAFQRNAAFLQQLSEKVDRDELVQRVSAKNDPDLMRIALEYLPLTFSRRHGDPTRPWNTFSIELNAADGSENLSYQGNWRDIFQNWEALSLAYPRFTSGMIFRFVNASTADGYNPYRITKNGFEWETIDPGDPWANIGYWGDHQIIYLLKLLEWSRRFDPAGLDQWLDRKCCTYAQVPYRIRGYDQIRRNPQVTIDFDQQLADQIEKRVASLGADGKLLADSNGQPHHVSLAEKLLVPALVKITNFVPGGGVWLNTQRPEWNDANNALVGNGLSVVTACYLRRFFAFMNDWFASNELPDSIHVSREVAALLHRVSDVLREHSRAFTGVISDEQRKQIIDALSLAGSEYREQLYDQGLSGQQVDLPLSECQALFHRCLAMIDHTIESNRRSDGLYHSYNLLALDDDTAQIERLYEMLEGQVAVLSSGLLSAQQAAELLDALRASKIYRPDQQSYMLYPNRDLPRFLEKNSLPQDSWLQSPLLQKLLADGDSSIVRRDCKGDVHFNGDFCNVSDLLSALDSLRDVPQYSRLAKEDRNLVCKLFELTFNHRDFTGRSGTFFGYEGLGSIYWHMVSKLAVATMENFVAARQSASDPTVLNRLLEHYRNIRDGIGLTKSPQQYGAFPSDPYSHTPENAGVQQPGMTGQVKEDIVARLAELGIRMDNGVLSFDPVMFESSELLDDDSIFEFIQLNGQPAQMQLTAGSFAYTFCQVPIVYRNGERRLIVHRGGQEPEYRSELSLTRGETASLAARRGEITRIDVYFEPTN